MQRLALVALLIAGCELDPPTEGSDPEVITTVELTLTPQGGGESMVATFADPENDGSPTVDPIVLAPSSTWDLAVRFLNELEDPAEDITLEIEDEADEHQVFFTGSALDVVTVTATDADPDGLPVGLASEVVTLGEGTGTLTVTLRHLPVEGGVPNKVAGLSDQVADDGDLRNVGGETDAVADFPLTVTK